MKAIYENQGFQAKVIEHSISPHGKELITLQLRYPRLVHSEFMTHRVFSRNASSSRAIPVQRMIDQVRSDPAMPVHWGKNQPGMQARAEVEGRDLIEAKQLWQYAAYQAAETAQKMMEMGLHKQVVNRILEPFQWIHVIVSSTEWGNWDELRDHEDADPNIALLAKLAKKARGASKPVVREGDGSWAANWHLPYVTPEERHAAMSDPRYLARLSGARCARVSYLTHDGKEPDPAKDIGLYEKLVGSRPLHASPVEHQGYPWDPANPTTLTGNFKGWIQHRKLIEREIWTSN